MLSRLLGLYQEIKMYPEVLSLFLNQFLGTNSLFLRKKSGSDIVTADRRHPNRPPVVLQTARRAAVPACGVHARRRHDGPPGAALRHDLESSNGTFVNNQRIEPRRYVELLERDVLKFGFSTREYVILHEESHGDENLDDDVAVAPGEEEGLAAPEGASSTQPH
ncbi:hypothetical protein HPB48_022026 [Haemaphysalis longicornis]|uniref:FHA domain-containing protein n=1 Tax=Haemaphysalis longicornis TaxID=44386 RepID=A0A9J6H5C6_HAELO|nr:hypothetical protein HPB48_022026 [Haemaphysalis longicornis]